MSSFFHIICEHVNEVALSAALSNSKHGLFYDKTMLEARFLEESCKTHKGVLLNLLKVTAEPAKSELQSALVRFNSMHQNKLFSNSSDADDGVRCQAAGIRMMISYIIRKRANMKSGTRTSPEIRELIDAAGSAPGVSALKASPTPSPSPTRGSSSSSYKQVGPKPEVDYKKIFGFSRLQSPEPLDSEDVTAIESSQEQATPKGTLQHKQYTDWAANKLVRLFSSGALEVAEMTVKEGQAFMWGRFRDGEEVASGLC
jgi:hypothetical protein